MDIYKQAHTKIKNLLLAKPKAFKITTKYTL